VSSTRCGWCVNGLVRPEFLADLGSACAGCTEHRAYKGAVAKPTDCHRNPYHLCRGGNNHGCICDCHRVDSLLSREISVEFPKTHLTPFRNNRRLSLRANRLRPMINRNRPELWKEDTAASVAMYNRWFMEAAPQAYRNTRAGSIESIKRAFEWSRNMKAISPELIHANPEVVSALRMSTAPPLAVDRLVGLSGVSKSFVANLEKGTISRFATKQTIDFSLNRICAIVSELLDRDLFSWVDSTTAPLERDTEMAATVVADRLCGAIANPIVRNAQEQRQLELIQSWLLKRGYVKLNHPSELALRNMKPGTFSFRQNVIVGAERSVNIPVDVVIQPHQPAEHGLPHLIEAKSAGDFTNTNKRRKEEAQKLNQLRATYGPHVSLTLFLCGYFDGGYLGYSATEGLDWVWEHRIDDLEKLGV
jgi:hypothetical protein